jgi:hypothetical protein
MPSKIIYHRSKRRLVAEIANAKVPKQGNSLPRPIRPHLRCLKLNVPNSAVDVRW